VIDPTARWTVDVAALASRSRNSPYLGRTLTGQVRHTVYAGEAVVIDAEAQR
jgi:dihydroorotase